MKDFLYFFSQVSTKKINNPFDINDLQTKENNEILIMTYNVNFEINKPEKVCEAISLSNADVICLQETNEEWEKNNFKF